MKKNIFLILGSVLALTACERATENPVQPVPLSQEAPPLVDPAMEPPAVDTVDVAPSLSVANVILHPAGNAPTTFAVEIAKTPQERREGLMGRENLGDKHGMWFVFEDDVQDPFWMKDTPVALDIIFVDKDYNVVDLFANTTPNSELLLVPKQKYRYVLEVKAGTTATNKVAIGDKVEFRLGTP